MPPPTHAAVTAFATRALRNVTVLAGHAGRHSPSYHKHVLDALQKATQGRSGKEYKEALMGALNTLRKELETNPDLVKMK